MAMEQHDLDLLQSVPPYHLQAVAKTRRLPLATKGLPLLTTSTSTLTLDEVTAIAPHLFNAASIGEAMRSLNALETAILRELLACGGRANSRDLALYLISSGILNLEKAGGVVPATPASEPQGSLYPTPHPHGPFELALRRLLLLGLVFWSKQLNLAGRDYASGVYDAVLIVPVAVREAARAVWPDIDQPAAQEEITALAVGASAWELQKALYLYWSLVASAREGFSLLNSGLLARAALRQVIDLLQPRSTLEQIRAENEVPRLLFIRLLLMELGLLRVQQGSLRAAPAEAYFALPLLERMRRCYRLWLERPFWNEMGALPDVLVRPGPAPTEPAHEEVVRARQTIIERLRHESGDDWHDITAFIARSKLYAPYLLFPRKYGPRAERYSEGGNPYGWDFRLRRGWLTHREGWHIVEGGFIRAVLNGPLQWLGLLEVKPDGSAFRLLPEAPLIMSEMPREGMEPTWGRLIVQPNFDLMAMAPVSEALLMQLDRFAERLRLEHVAYYRLTKQSVTRAIQTGLRAEEIQQMLETAAGGSIPQNVQYSLVEWERQARRIELWPRVALLEVDSPQLLDSLYADEETRPLLGRRLSLVLAEVAPRHLPAVQQALWQRDCLPALSSAPPQDSLLSGDQQADREPQWRLHENGLLQPLYAVTNLYLVTEAERISERHEESGWQQITPVSIQRAREAGISLDAIVRFLQQYCAGGIPASFLIRLKLWGGGYSGASTVAVERAPLLRLPAQILQDIQADAELQSLLGSEVPPHTRLVRVPAEHLAQVIELLRERGFEIED